MVESGCYSVGVYFGGDNARTKRKCVPVYHHSESSHLIVYVEENGVAVSEVHSFISENSTEGNIVTYTDELIVGLWFHSLSM